MEYTRLPDQRCTEMVRFWSSRRLGEAFTGEWLKPILERLRNDPFMSVRREALLLFSEKFPEVPARRR
jgi:hypothetical protein